MTEDQKSNGVRPPLEGINGWLLFFCISLTVIGPILLIRSLFADWEAYRPIFVYHELFKTKCIIFTILTVGTTLFSIYTGIALWAKCKNAVKIGKIFLLSALIYRIIGDLLPFITAVIVIGFSNLYVAYLFMVMVERFAPAMLVFFIWDGYLTESRRVKATYLREAHDDRCLSIR